MPAAKPSEFRRRAVAPALAGAQPIAKIALQRGADMLRVATAGVSEPVMTAPISAAATTGPARHQVTTQLPLPPTLGARKPDRQTSASGRIRAVPPAASEDSLRGAQTLDRGLQILEQLSHTGDAMTIAEIAARIGVHRSVATRLLVTLESKGYVERRADRAFVLGVRILELSRHVQGDLRSFALPILTEVAEQLGATAVLTRQDGNDAVVISVVEPPASNLHLSFRIGSRHALDRGAEGMAILAGRPPAAAERPEVAIARRAGYAVTVGEVQDGTWGLAAPINPIGRAATASIGVIAPYPMNEAEVAKVVMQAAARIAAGAG